MKNQQFASLMLLVGDPGDPPLLNDHSGGRGPRRKCAVTPVSRISPFRLEFCSEFTKPHSLTIREMGTPKNHRSPPA